MKLRDILFRNAIITDLKPGDKQDVLKRLATFLCSLHDITDVDSVVSGILSRETETSTGIGFGIAVPHVRTEIAHEIYLACARCPEGIEFDALDNNPVKLIFLLIVPRQRSNNYQDILQAISGIMLYENMREELLNAETPESFIKVLVDGEEKYLN